VNSHNLKLARSLAIEIKHTASCRPLTHEELETIREAAALIVELLSEAEVEVIESLAWPARPEPARSPR
jgi:hypothetical protein